MSAGDDLCAKICTPRDLLEQRFCLAGPCRTHYSVRLDSEEEDGDDDNDDYDYDYDYDDEVNYDTRMCSST